MKTASHIVSAAAKMTPRDTRQGSGHYFLTYFQLSNTPFKSQKSVPESIKFLAARYLKGKYNYC